MATLVICSNAFHLAYADGIGATSGTCGDNLVWELSNGTLTVSGTGAMTDFFSSSGAPGSTPWEMKKDEIVSVVIQSGVTSVGAYAFTQCNSLESVSLPSTVKHINRDAFSRSQLLTMITLPEGLETLEYCVFEYCKGLHSINIPSSLTKIDSSCFGYSGLQGTITIPSTVTTLGEDVFYGCKGLTKIEFPVGLNTLPRQAACSCSNLEEVVIGNGTSKIDSMAFEYCSSLKTVIIPATVTEIGFRAFADTSSDAEIYYLGSRNQWNAVAIGLENAALRSVSFHFARFDINIDSGITNGSVSFKVNGEEAVTALENDSVSLTIIPYAGYELDTLTVRQGETEVIVTDNTFKMPSGDVTVTAIFKKQSFGTPDFKLPAAVKQIEDEAFESVSFMTVVDIPDGCESIGKWAFKDCTGLTQIRIPASVTNIDELAFDGCADVLVYGTSPSTAKSFCDLHTNCTFVAENTVE